jgi:hypothetical protein
VAGSLFDRRKVRRTRSGDYELRLDEEERALLRHVGPQLRAMLDGDLADPALRRLFPTAYHDDVERDREYQQLVRDELADRRRAAADLLVATADRDRLDEDELQAWLRAVNDLRLVIGTRLDVSEDRTEVDPDDPDLPLHALYEWLGVLLESIVTALTP